MFTLEVLVLEKSVHGLTKFLRSFPDYVKYIVGCRGSRKLKVGDFTYTKNKESVNKTYWSCARAGMHKCKARVLTYTLTNGEQNLVVRYPNHNHDPF